MHELHLFLLRFTEIPIRTEKADGKPMQQPFELTFEDARIQIEKAGGYCEGDGAFGWFGNAGKIVGVLHCIDDRLISVEAFSTLPSEEFSQFLQDLGLRLPIWVQLPQTGALLTIAEFLNQESWLEG